METDLIQIQRSHSNIPGEVGRDIQMFTLTCSDLDIQEGKLECVLGSFQDQPTAGQILILL